MAGRIIGEVQLIHQFCEVTIRACTEVPGQRPLRRMENAWIQIPNAAFESLVTGMLERLTIFTGEDLRSSTANRIFRSESGRASQFEFINARLMTSTDRPRLILIVIELSRSRHSVAR